MNCVEFRKYVEAFADGELSTERNLDALEHLKMCPGCVRRVDGIHSLKRALLRLEADTEAPPRLRAAILARGDEASSPIGAGMRGWWLRAGVPLTAVAAGVVFALWMTGSWFEPRPLPGQTTLLRALAVDARQQHRSCEVMGPDHHDPALPRDLAGVASAMSRAIRLRVIAPDLSAAGYRFLGADRCGIRGRPGAHVLYQSTTSGLFLSVFTVPRVIDLQMNRVGGPDNASYFAATQDGLTVAAWSEGGQSYVWCARLPEPVLLPLLEACRTLYSPARGDLRPAG